MFQTHGAATSLRMHAMVAVVLRQRLTGKTGPRSVSGGATSWLRVPRAASQVSYRLPVAPCRIAGQPVAGRLLHLHIGEVQDRPLCRGSLGLLLDSLGGLTLDHPSGFFQRVSFDTAQSPTSCTPGPGPIEWSFRCDRPIWRQCTFVRDVGVSSYAERYQRKLLRSFS
jgi:hypothetical protein